VLSADIIRAWEKRYAVVAPKRGPRGARLYTRADVAHLSLLRRVTAAGRAIGDVAKLGRAELEALDGAKTELAFGEPGLPDVGAAAASDVVARMIDALERFDFAALDRALAGALIGLGTGAFRRLVAEPLLDEVGQRWSDGRLSVADEHLLSALLRNLLTGVMRMRGPSSGPTVLLATPAGERHEFGILLAGMSVADAGLPVCYLGTDLPAAEITAAARRARAAVVGLGMVNSENRSAAAAAARKIERALPPSVEVWLGGRDAANVAARLGRSRAIVFGEMTAVESELTRLRAQ
jgi:DNA-binding transcriptional MerR regulator/methylmalonyl-CoA mutase cobalamin-binding subunit